MSTLDYSVNLATVADVPPELEAAWSSGLQAAATTKIKPRWDAIVGTDVLWTANVANPSNANWKDMVNPTFVSRRGRSPDTIIATQLRKLGRAFTKAKAAHDAMFAGGGANFDTAVTNKSGNWTANVGQSLGLTGFRFGGRRGPASIVVRLASGDNTYIRDLGGGPGPSGTVDPTIAAIGEVPYIQAILRSEFRAAFEGFLIAAGVSLLTGDITDTDAMNATSDRLLLGFRTTATPDPPTQFIHFAVGPPATLSLHLDNGGVTP
jgi:hypothetical protein